jgi:N-acetyl-gamma-glutamyl-phosphate reductase
LWLFERGGESLPFFLLNEGEMSNKVKVGIAGASGYGGGELIHLLLNHPKVEIKRLSAESNAGERLSSLFPNLPDIGILEKTSAVSAWSDLDILFTALPAGMSSRIVATLPKPHPVVIDLGPDYRFAQSDDFSSVYHMDHGAPETLPYSTYGLVEWNRESISKAQYIGSPGCFPTGALLGILPFLREGLLDKGPVIVDGKSGVSGAGRGLTQDTHYPEIAEGMKAYKPIVHRHVPEMENAMSTLSGQSGRVVFVPHLIPINRGLISTIYLPVLEDVTAQMVESVLLKYQNDNPFVRIVNSPPNSAHVRGTNRIDIHAVLANKVVVVMTAIDNLVKGAAGQAIQSMNLVLGEDEKMGLPLWGAFP